ncbi:hypothetical protein CC1G_08984 [Coprinopsis cinerea okayama7|uniref:Uncharacterized protein n=1 Tax=Coprinopsis cinerea (strain Okayama-7 / 130 / ATCC MYA-4618 / FGSC 9003) TaxID=240176 RepID=A8P4V2_COPC7|nr:hypothetical protein CC1G_08984 [Coprinopsis cinerea okayama7\|eukprot:XP_001838820.2 hypothetical protein CC1G_08984 [Coprinopsis cinerea okayama7\
MASLQDDRKPHDGDDSEWTATKARSQVPLWLPISAFVGTTLALAIPMLMVRRQRNMVSKMSLHGSTAAPPRRLKAGGGGATAEETTARLKSLAAEPSSSRAVDFKMESASDSEGSGVGSMMSAMSRLNLQNALFAGKAFAIATALVAVGGTAFAWTVKSVMGVQDTREFGIRVRAFLWSAWPGLTSSIHRAPQNDDERTEGNAVAPFGIQEEWKWEEAENRLKRAYEEGGFPLWAKTALREMEAEARVERAKRQREIEESLRQQKV